MDIKDKSRKRSPHTRGNGLAIWDNGRLHRLTGRDVSLLGCLAKGLRNKEIAYQLDLAECTTKLFLHRISARMGMNRVQMAIWAHDHKLDSLIQSLKK